MGKHLMNHRLVAIVILALNTLACGKNYEVARLNVGEGRSIIISAKRFPDDTQPIYYQVAVNGRAVISPTYISSEEPVDVKHFHLRIVKNNDGSIAGVIEEKLPQKILVLHNFATGQTWPRCEVGGPESCERTGKMLVDELQKDHPEVRFIL